MERIVVAINRVVAGVGTALILGQMALICSDIFGRAALNHPVPGVFEVIELTIVAIVFLQLPNAVQTNGFIRSDALFASVSRRRPRLAQGMETVYCSIGALVLFAIAWGMWDQLDRAITRNLFTGNPGIYTAPIWPAYACVVTGAALGALNYLLRIFVILRDPERLVGESAHDGA